MRWTLHRCAKTKPAYLWWFLSRHFELKIGGQSSAQPPRRIPEISPGRYTGVTILFLSPDLAFPKRQKRSKVHSPLFVWDHRLAGDRAVLDTAGDAPDRCVSDTCIAHVMR
eukprot:1186944-Prorocentrum_minimum.AAC.2